MVIELINELFPENFKNQNPSKKSPRNLNPDSPELKHSISSAHDIQISHVEGKNTQKQENPNLENESKKEVSEEDECCIIKPTIFSRKHCAKASNGEYIKDLFLVKDRHLKDIVIVDYKPQSFAFNLCNGVLIPHWNGSKADRILDPYIDYLIDLSKHDDCRWVNLKRMKYKKVYEVIDAHQDEIRKEVYEGSRTKSDNG